MRVAAISPLILGFGLLSTILSLLQPPLGPADPTWAALSATPMPAIESFPIPADLPHGMADAF